jgi:Holliday junction resolvase RusA-like endonuclease
MDSKTEAEQRRVLECWKEQTRQEKAPEGIPVSLFVQVFKRTRKTDACDVKPDLDNIVKAIMDALNGYAFEDDKQVVSITARKFKDGSKDGFECVKVKLYW